MKIKKTVQQTSNKNWKIRYIGYTISNKMKKNMNRKMMNDYRKKIKKREKLDRWLWTKTPKSNKWKNLKTTYQKRNCIQKHHHNNIIKNNAFHLSHLLSNYYKKHEHLRCLKFYFSTHFLRFNDRGLNFKTEFQINMYNKSPGRIIFKPFVWHYIYRKR